MKIKYILKIIFILSVITMLQSCEKTEPEGIGKPRNLEIRGCEYDNSNKFLYKVKIPSSGGRFIVNGAKDEEGSYITQIYDPLLDKFYEPTNEERNFRPPYLNYGSSWLSGDWWGVKYILEQAPYEMVFDIEPIHSLKSRTLIVTYGVGQYSSKLLIEQNGLG